MKRTQLNKINEVLEKFAIMDYPVNAGLYSNPRDLISTLPKYRNGLFYTELQIIAAIKNNGLLLIHNNLDEMELVQQVFSQEGVEYALHEDKHIIVRTYIKALRLQLYAQQDEKLEILHKRPDIQIA
jgi:hypothetical protein